MTLEKEIGKEFTLIMGLYLNECLFERELLQSPLRERISSPPVCISSLAPGMYRLPLLWY